MLLKKEKSSTFTFFTNTENREIERILTRGEVLFSKPFKTMTTFGRMQHHLILRDLTGILCFFFLCETQNYVFQLQSIEI